MNPASSDIVVTGVGLATPLGADRESAWRGLIAGRSAASDGAARTPVPEGPGPRAVMLALRAAAEAAADAGLSAPLGPAFGCAVSCSKPLIVGDREMGDGGWEAENQVPGFLSAPVEGLRLLEPSVVPRSVARALGVGGPVMNLSAACATGVHSVAAAAGWIREGRCEAALAGASESSLHPLYQAGFARMGVLSRARVARPFDRRRDGFVLGEGAAVFVLESPASARRRGARVYGTVMGWDLSSDAHHPVHLNGDGRRMAAALAGALRRAGLPREELGYVNAHGTATVLNDRLETLALLDAFRGGTAPPVSSTKAATGHLLGAAGAVELGFCLLALRDGVLPPTLNLEEPETDRLDFIPGEARSRRIRAAASLSFGFGGALAAIVVGRP